MRSVLAIAASKLKISPREISFSRAARLTQVFGNKIRMTTSEQEHKKIIETDFVALNQVKHPSRKKRRVEPRLCVIHKDRFPLMKNSRADEKLKTIELNMRFGHRNHAYAWEKRAQ